MKKALLNVLGFVIITLFGYAQKDTSLIIYSNFLIIPDDNQIVVHFAIDAGSTCNGIKLYHSTDNLNYVEINYFPGVCGNLSSSVSYTYKHNNPELNKTNYYKLLLGKVQYTEPIAFYLKHIEPNKISIKQNPITNNKLEFEFYNKSNDIYDISIINTLGSVLYIDRTTQENKVVNIDLFKNGKYFLVITDSKGKKLQTSFLVVN